MNPGRAKEIMETELEDTFMGSAKEWKAAVKLSSEALIAILKWRIDFNDEHLLKLPSETKE